MTEWEPLKKAHPDAQWPWILQHILTASREMFTQGATPKPHTKRPSVHNILCRRPARRRWRGRTGNGRPWQRPRRNRAAHSIELYIVTF